MELVMKPLILEFQERAIDNKKDLALKTLTESRENDDYHMDNFESFGKTVTSTRESADDF